MNGTDGRVDRLERELAEARRRIEELELRLTERHDERRVAGFPAEEGFFAGVFRRNLVPMSISTLREGRYVEVNDAFLKIVGRTREEVIGNTSTGLGFITPAQRDVILREISEKGRADNVELPAVTRGGELRYGLFNTSKITMGREDYLLAVITDITERVHAEKALERSETLLRGITNNLPGAVYQFHAGPTGEMGLSYISARAFDLLGLENDPEKFFPQFTACMVPEERDAFLASVRGAVRTFSSWDREVRFIKPTTGEELFVRVISQPRKTHDGIVFDGVLLDVTAHKRAENALRESEAKYRLLADKISDIVWATDRDFNLTYMSPSVEKVMGYTPEERLGKQALSIMTPESAAKAFESFLYGLQEARETGADPGSRLMELEYIHKNGSTVWMEVSARILLDGEGNIVGAQGVSRDITERKRSEDALKERQARLDSIFRAAPTGIGVIVDRRILEVNERVCEMTGYAREELVGNSARMLYLTDEEFAHVGTEKYRQILETGIGSVETRWRRKDGTVMDILLTSSVIREGDLSSGVTFTALDISEKKRAEERLLLSEKKFSTAFHLSPFPMGITGLEDGVIMDVNQAFISWSGYAREDLIGYTAMQVGMWPRQWSRDLLKKVLLKRGAVNSFEIVFQTMHGEKRNVLYSATLIDIDGRPYILSTSQDITERVQAVEELKKQHDRMETLVMERTAELREAYEQLREENESRKATESALRAREQELEKGRRDLEEMNAALRVLLRQRDEDRSAHEMNLKATINLSVMPFLEKLEKSPLAEGQRAFVAMAKAGLEEIVSPFTREVSSEYLGFTPAEIQVAMLIREGKTSKEIAGILNISPNTVHAYRNRIRKKTNTKNRKVNLRAYLQSLG
ncbi:MAG TPA: PAS domain S-box protein [Deltaproteobacteria bacterium]|nr:PAS domain S-box protein [Deltaproteobacteria bacterium]HQI82351.1 PAS domain S-box protein [Deltaproteobacteria bacterium]